MPLSSLPATPRVEGRAPGYSKGATETLSKKEKRKCKKGSAHVQSNTASNSGHWKKIMLEKSLLIRGDEIPLSWRLGQGTVLA